MDGTIKVQINVGNGIEKDILVAMLSDMQFYAFEEGENELYCYLYEKDYDKISLEEALRDCNYTVTLVEPENWNKRWESEFEPVVVDHFVAVRAIFHSPITSVKHEIIITPKMSFGTGHHATTYLMMRLMEQIDFKGKRVLDFGTGTGVLAILVEKLGATNVQAIDNDEWSIMNAEENIGNNNCSAIHLFKADEPPEGEVFDIILANINLHVLLANVEKLKNCCDSGSTVLVSGILADDEVMISRAFEAKGFTIEAVEERSKWLCIKFSLL
jgi:ribosomal protein L11 methyltransferase